jgi:hypothetical protein
MPINGAFYWWTAVLAPRSASRFMSFVAGWVTIMQIVTSLASFAFACGTSFSYLIPLLVTGWISDNFQRMAIGMATVIFWGSLSFLQIERISLVFIFNCTLVLKKTPELTLIRCNHHRDHYCIPHWASRCSQCSASTIRERSRHFWPVC